MKLYYCWKRVHLLSLNVIGCGIYRYRFCSLQANLRMFLEKRKKNRLKRKTEIRQFWSWNGCVSMSITIQFLFGRSNFVPPRKFGYFSPSILCPNMYAQLSCFHLIYQKHLMWYSTILNYLRLFILLNLKCQISKGRETADSFGRVLVDFYFASHKKGLGVLLSTTFIIWLQLLLFPFCVSREVVI